MSQLSSCSPPLFISSVRRRPSVGRARALGVLAFDTAFDRGALVAVTPLDREAYARTLSSLMGPNARVLLVVVEHEGLEDGRKGPPFSVSPSEVIRYARYPSLISATLS